jgi:putative pyrroloquinoline-quinone binding quinoprotein
VNTEERQLAEMLHRVTPEPPRRVTVEDIAYRVASESRGSGRERAPRPRRGFSFGSRRWAPALAALSVVAIAGATVGIATVANSHHSNAPASNGTPTSSASVSSSSSSPSPSERVTSVPPGALLRVANGIWGAGLLNRQSFDQESLTGSGDSLYAFGNGTLNRIDPATGSILQSASYTAPVTQQPVVAGGKVWVVSAYGGGEITLRGYDSRTLAPVATVQVPAIGGVASSAAGVLAAGPDGKLYVAAGQSIAVVNPASGQVTRPINLTAGRASSVAIAADGGPLYVGIGSADSFRLLTYNAETGRIVGSSTMPGGSAGNLVATSGGIWGTTGTGMSEWVWFAPGWDLSRAVRVSQGAGGGLYSLPNASGGAVWIGGSHELVCASPATGKVLARATIPADHSIVEYFASPTVLSNGHAYALYQDQHAQLAGVAQLTPPQACTGG